MLVKQAKEIARQWILDDASRLPGFEGAFYHGSINWMSETCELPANSDIDIVLVLNDIECAARTGKFRYRDLLIDASAMSAVQLGTASDILIDYRLAGSFRISSVILDRTGRLTVLNEAVIQDYANSYWVRQRCLQAEANALGKLRGVDSATQWHNKVLAWLFAASITTHVLLTAGLRNPTVRTRYLKARELLEEYDLPEFYERMLEVAGCGGISRQEVVQHLAAMTEAFDAAKMVVLPGDPFASDLTDDARPVAVDGSRELIERGYHQEAVFWIAATYLRCMAVLSVRASRDTQQRYQQGCNSLLANLDIGSVEDLQIRADRLRSFLPEVMEVAVRILRMNRQVDHARNEELR